MNMDFATMDLAQFEDGLDRYGADVERWPAALREAGQTCLAGSAEARALQHDLHSIEAMLAARADRPPPGFASRAMRASQQRLPLVVARVAWSAAAAAVLLFGLLLGGGSLNDGADKTTAIALDTLKPLDVD